MVIIIQNNLEKFNFYRFMKYWLYLPVFGKYKVKQHIAVIINILFE